MYILRVSGMYWTGDTSPESTIADMLRYDDGELINWISREIEGLRTRKHFVAEVHTNHFTPDRWKSFGLKAVLLRKEKGIAGCNYPDTASVTRAIQAHK